GCGPRHSLAGDTLIVLLLEVPLEYFARDVRAFDAPRWRVHGQRRNRNLRFVRGREAYEPRIMTVLLVSTERARFAGHRHTGNERTALGVEERLVRRPIERRLNHHARHFRRCVGRYRTT